MNIVSIAQNVPGPVAVARLVGRGAHAVKIEPPSGDQLATLCPRWYDELHKGVQVERIDLKSGAGRRALETFLRSADLFMASQRPAALERLGLDAPAMLRGFPALRHLNIVGDTAHPDQSGHDLTYLAQHGLIGDSMPLTLVADMVGAERAAAAAIQLVQSPPGTSAIVGLADAIADLAAPLRHRLTAPGGPLGGGNPAYRLYAAREGRIAVAALEAHFRARLYELLGATDGTDLSTSFATKSAREWEQWARDHDLPIVAVRDERGQTPKSSLS